VLIVGGLLKLGWAAEFMSRPIVTGFVFGLVLLIILGEIPSLLGMPPVSGDVFSKVWGIIGHIAAGDIKPLTALIGLSSLAILFVGARFAPRIPWGLLVLMGAIVTSNMLDLAGRGVVTVGAVPTGLPALAIPDVGLSELGPS
jgi:sulfate permease, SulP family